MLAIALLGAPTLTRDATPLPLTRRKSRALLYYLAAHSPQTPLTREQLLALFWPDLERPAAQQTLRSTLYGLRKLLNHQLLIEDDTLALSADVQIDVRQFVAGLQALGLASAPDTQVSHPLASTSEEHMLSATLQLYRGDFLAGFSLPDSAEFDDWAAVEREHYRRLAIRGLTALSQIYEAQGNFAAALETLDRALAFDALQEDLQRAAMRLHYLAGDRPAAIRRYDALRKLLDEEMGVPPMTETRAVYDSIINDTLVEIRNQRSGISLKPGTPPQSPISSAQSLPFTGRTAELQTLQAMLTAHRLALLEGEPGIGKTRLAEEFIGTVNTIALIGSAHELEQPLPYQPILEALRLLLTRTDWPALQAALQANVLPVWLAEVSRLVPELAFTETDSADAAQPSGKRIAAPTSPATESQLWEGLHQFLFALATQHPVTFFIDDLQWADASTLALLGYLIRRSQAPTPIFYLAAARAVAPRSPLAALLQTLTREDRLTRLPLTRLKPEAVATLTQHLCRSHNEALTGWLAQSSEGNPYVLAELFRYVLEKGIVSPEGQVDLATLSSAPIVPQSIYTLTQARLNRLTDSARRVLDAAVAAGREFDFEIVYRAAGLSESAALDAIDELRNAGLIHPQAWPSDKSAAQFMYTFDHSITLEVAYREVGEARHRLLHRRVAEALETVHGHGRLDSAAGLIAYQFIEGYAPERAAPYALHAGRQAAQLAAWKEAAEFFEQALSAELADQQRYPIQMELGEVLFQGSQTAQATEAFRAAVALAPPKTPEADQAHLALARSLFTQARFAEAIDYLQQVTEAQPAILAQREFIWAAALSVEGADLATAIEHLQRAESLFNQSSGPGDLPLLAQIKFELGSVAAQQGALHQAIELYRESLDIAEEAPGESALGQRILARNNLAYHLHLLGDPTAIEYARAGLALAQEKGRLILQPFLFSTLGEIALAAGDLEAAEKFFTQGLTLAEQLSMPERIAGLTANLGLVARAQGQRDLAIHRLSTALARADALGTRHLAAQIRLWLVPLLPAAEARTYLAEARAFAESSGRQKLLAEAEQLAQTFLESGR